MRRSAYKRYLVIGGVLFLVLTLPLTFVEKMRGGVMACLAPFLKGGKLFTREKSQREDRLETENHLLRLEIGKLCSLLEQKNRIDALQEEMRQEQLESRRLDELKSLNSLASQAVAAQVIYRDPANWSNACWINVGKETNERLKYPIIQKNSPVIVGRSVVGAIDYVGGKQSRVLLITDPSLTPSVRAIRGFSQQMMLLEHVAPLVRYLKLKNEGMEHEHQMLVRFLEKWHKQLAQERENWYLAKGILQGGKKVQWRTPHHTLRGIGFNYDFADEEGPARELLTGKPIERTEEVKTQPIIQVNDLLVTTGMDGIFPPGLRVAEVTKIFPLKEGAYSYEIEAIPVVENLDALNSVFIIPPQGSVTDEDR